MSIVLLDVCKIPFLSLELITSRLGKVFAPLTNDKNQTLSLFINTKQLMASQRIQAFPLI